MYSLLVAQRGGGFGAGGGPALGADGSERHEQLVAMNSRGSRGTWYAKPCSQRCMTRAATGQAIRFELPQKETHDVAGFRDHHLAYADLLGPAQLRIMAAAWRRSPLIRSLCHFFSTKPGGSGIGLSLACQIALAHGGRIDVERRHSGGSVFTLILPVSAPT